MPYLLDHGLDVRAMKFRYVSPEVVDTGSRGTAAQSIRLIDEDHFRPCLSGSYGCHEARDSSADTQDICDYLFFIHPEPLRLAKMQPGRNSHAPFSRLAIKSLRLIRAITSYGKGLLSDDGFIGRLKRWESGSHHRRFGRSSAYFSFSVTSSAYPSRKPSTIFSEAFFAAWK